MNVKKRLLSLLLAVCMVAGMLPAMSITAFAAETQGTWGNQRTRNLVAFEAYIDAGQIGWTVLGTDYYTLFKNCIDNEMYADELRKFRAKIDINLSAADQEKAENGELAVTASLFHKIWTKYIQSVGSDVNTQFGLTLTLEFYNSSNTKISEKKPNIILKITRGEIRKQL